MCIFFVVRECVHTFKSQSKILQAKKKAISGLLTPVCWNKLFDWSDHVVDRRTIGQMKIIIQVATLLELDVCGKLSFFFFIADAF